MFGLFKAKKNEPTSSTSRTVAKDGAAVSPRTEIRPKFEIKADFGGINGWPADVSVVSYLSAQGLICAGTESGALLVYGQSFQYYRPHSPCKSLCIKRILGVGTDICLVVYNDNSLAVFRLPTLELLDSLESSWLTNSNDYPGIELSCIHVDDYAEKSLRTFVYVGTSIGDIYVIEVATSSGCIRISDFAVTLRDVEIAHPMRVTAILSDEKCLMVGYETSSLHHEDSDKDGDLDVSSFPGSPGNEFSNRFHCAVDMLVPAASSKCIGMVVVFNITKRRVRHSYITTAGVSFLLMDSLGDALYAVLRTGEILSLVACSGKSQYSSIWSTNLLSNDSYYYSDDAQQIVKQIRWLPPQTNNNNNSAAGCYFLLLNNDNIVCLSPCSAQGKMTEITSLRPQNCEEISDIHIVPVAQAKKGWTDKKNSSQHGGIFASAGLLVVTKRVPSDAYYRAKRSETGGKVSISNERYRSNTESQMVSRGVHLRIIPCPAGISMIPSAAGGATAIEIAVAIAVAITEPSPPSSVAKEKSKSSSSSYASNIDLPFLKENSLTCINALPPCSSSSSMATVLLNLSHNTCDDQEESKKRDMAIIKIRSCSHNGQADLFGDNANIVRNEVVLAQKEINSQKQSKYEFDLLFLGQKNGTLSVWACSPTFNSTPTPTSAPSSAPPSPSTLAPAPPTASQATNRADQNNIQNNLRPYHAMWRQVFTFDCTSNADLPLSQRAFSPSSSPVSSPMSNIFSPPAGSATTGSAWVTVISPDEGSGLFAVGTSDGSVIVWEVCQSDSSMGGVEYLARTYAVARQTDSYKSDGTRSAERSISNSNSPSPQTSNRNLVFSWDDDEDDDEEANDDDDDDDEEEEAEVDAAIVYDIRKAIIPPDKVLSELIRRGQEEKDNRFEMKSREGSSRGSNKYPGLDTASLSLKMNLVLTNDMSSNNENENVRDYFAENGPFQPDDVRTTFRARVAGSITSLLLLSDCLMLIVGTSEGAVWISRGMDDQSMVQINLSGMWKVSSKTPGSASPSDIFVAGFHYSVYSSDCDGSNSRDAAAPIPVVYVMFSCGNIAVICLQTLTMVSYCLSEESTEGSGLSSILKKRSGGGAKKSSNDSYRDSQFNDFDGSDNECEVDSTIPTRTVIACTVTDYSHTVMKRPQYKGAYIIKELDGKKGVSLTFLTLHGAVEPSPASPAASRKFDTAREERAFSQERANLRPRSQSNTDAYMSNDGSSKTSPRQYHSQLPRYLIIAVGTCIVTYDIGKFCKMSSSAGRSRRSYSIVSYSGESNDSTAEVTYTSVRSGVQSSQTVGTSPIIAARHFNYSDKLSSSSSSSSSSSPSAADASCLTLVNGYGRMPTINIKEKTKLSDDDLYQKCGEFKVSSPITSPDKDERNLRKERDSESLYRDEMNSAGSEPAIPFNSSLKAGVLLGNGSCYLLQRSGLLLHYNLSESNTHSVSGKQPSRLSSSITTIPPSSSLHVSSEQESKIANYQNAFRGKQSSMFGVTVHSGPADLLKLFSKSRDKNYRREKIKFERPSLKSISSLSSSLVCSKDDNERSSDRVDRDRDREKDKERETGRDSNSVASSPTIRNRRSFFASGSSRDKDKDKDRDRERERERSTTANTKANTDSVASNMSEALRSLEERGEKLGRINNQADELNDGAHRFRDLIKQQKQDLQKKANRWGL